MTHIISDVEKYRLEKVKNFLNANFDISILDIVKKSQYNYKLKTSHKNAILIMGDNSATINMEFLSIQNNKIVSNYQTNEIINNSINTFNNYIHIFDALRANILFNKDGCPAKEFMPLFGNIKAHIDFEFSLYDSVENRFNINCTHKLNNPRYYTNKKIIAGSNSYPLAVEFKINGDIRNNYLKSYEKMIIEEWNGDDFINYGILTEMINI